MTLLTESLWPNPEGLYPDGPAALVPDLLTISVDTTLAGSASDTIEIPHLITAGKLLVVWGDGSDDEYTADGTATHTYAAGGVKTIKFYGKNSFIGQPIKFDNVGDKLKLLSVLVWGTDLKWDSMFAAFDGCLNGRIDEATDVPNLSVCTSMVGAFMNMEENINIDFSSWSAPICTNVDDLLRSQNNNLLTCPTLGDLIGSQTTTASGVFQNDGITSFDFDGKDYSNVETMLNFFRGCGDLVTITGEENLDLSSCQSIKAFHRDNDSITVIKLPTTFTSALTDMFELARGGFGIVDIENIELIDYTNITKMSRVLDAPGFIPQSRYDALLAKMVADGLNNVVIGMGASTFSVGQPTTDRATLVTNGCTITDGGQN